MNALLNKELKSLFLSKTAGWLAIGFTIFLAVIIGIASRWLGSSGDYDGAFSLMSLQDILKIVPLAFVFLVPAASAIHFFKGSRKYTIEKALINPTRLFWSKFLLFFLFFSIVLVTTLSYVFFDIASNDIYGSLGVLTIVVAYLSLLLIQSVFIAICLSVSILVNRAWLVFLFGTLICGLVYWGVDNSAISIRYHYANTLNGLLSFQFFKIILNSLFICFLFVVIGLQISRWRKYILFVLLFMIVNLGMSFLPEWNVDTRQVSQDEVIENVTSDDILKTTVKDIVFIEGHGETEQIYLLHAEEVLSQHYNIYRGEIGSEIGALDLFATVIIVGAKNKFEEVEKYILDQYLMQGGTILWLVDGVYISEEDLKMQGWSASIKNELNIDDLLANYGVKIKPQLIQDKECFNVHLVSNATGKSISAPNFYSPKVTLSQQSNHPIKTDDLSLMTSFASPVVTLSKIEGVKKEILFTSSKRSHLVNLPEMIRFFDIENSKKLFEESSIPMAVSLEGRFSSLYNAKIIPDEAKTLEKQNRLVSIHTKMVVIGNSSLIKNELSGIGEDTKVLPMGYDRVNGVVHSNAQFLQIVMEWLTNDEKIEDVLEGDKKKYVSALLLLKYFIINIIIPCLLLSLIFLCTFNSWKKK